MLDNEAFLPFGERTRAMFKVIGYVPTPAQLGPLASPARYIVLYGGIQSGKSIVASKKVLKEFVPDLRKALAKAERDNVPLKNVLPIIYWLVGGDYDACEREFRYVESDFAALGLLRRHVKRINPGVLEIIGGEHGTTVLAQIKTKSSKDFRTLRKESPMGIVMCEPGQQDLSTFERVMERAVPNEAWVLLAGTIEQSIGWYVSLGGSWGAGDPNRAVFRMKSSTNKYMFPDGDRDRKLVSFKDELGEALYNERFEGEAQRPVGMVFPEFRADFHVQDCEYMEKWPVQVWEDPGYGDESAHAVLVVQIVEGQVRIFDEIYERGVTTEDIIKDVVQRRPWYGDFEVLVDDPHYSTQHHSTTSTREIWRHLTSRLAKNKREPLRPRLERIHTFLTPTAQGVPKLLVNSKCKGLLSEFGIVANPFDKQVHFYRWRVDRDGSPLGDEPEDKWNHGIEALGRGLVYNFGHVQLDSETRQVRGWGRVQFFNEGRKRGSKRRVQH